MTERLYRILQEEKDNNQKVPSAKLLRDIQSPESGLFFPEGSMGFVFQRENDIMIAEKFLPEAESQNLFNRWYNSKKRNNSYLVLFPEGIVEVRPDDIEIFPIEKPRVDPDLMLAMFKENRRDNGSS